MLGSVQWAWLLFGSSGCSVAPGSGRMEVLSISAVHSDSLGAVIKFIYLLVCFCFFCGYLSLAILMAPCYEIVLCCDRIALLY